jgi:hypothetical protein
MRLVWTEGALIAGRFVDEAMAVVLVLVVN